MNWSNLKRNRWPWDEALTVNPPGQALLKPHTTLAKASSSSEKAMASTSAPECTNYYTSADSFDLDYAQLDNQLGDIVEMTRDLLKAHIKQGWSQYKIRWHVMHPEDISSPVPKAPMKASKPKPNRSWRATRPTGSKTSNTSKASELTDCLSPDAVRSAAAKASKSEWAGPASSARTSASAESAMSSSPSTNSSLSLTQWFDTLMGLSGLLTPKPNPGRATTLERIGPEELKRKFISGHLRGCTRNSTCHALRWTLLPEGALRPGVDLSFIASMILQAHGMRSMRPSET